MQYIIAYDFGTTGVKTCLFSIDGGIRMEASAYAPYGLYILPDGGAEQDADEWWAAMCSTTRAAFEKTIVRPECGIPRVSDARTDDLRRERGDDAPQSGRDACRVDERKRSALEIQMGTGARAGGLPKGAQMARREGISDRALHG